MTLSEELRWRGFTNQTTFKDVAAIDGEPLTFYWGVDPSADSMTIGNLAIALMVRHFIQHGHRAILLVGGATGLIGDPDGKSEERQLKSAVEIAHNKHKIVAQYNQLFASQPFEVVDNHDWFKPLGYLEFLRDVGKHVPMRQMLAREFVQSRLSEQGAGISYAEFSYALIQGYDFLHLFREKGVSLQVCGADQWGNSIAGVELIRRIANSEAHVWSAPLIVNKVTGTKFGKTEAGAIWLDETKTSVYQFYQFWLNVADDEVENLLKVYTLLDQPAIAQLMEEFQDNRGARRAQKTLADEVTSLVHGKDKATAVRKVTEALFGQGKLDDLSASDRAMLKAELPTVQASADDSVAQLLVKARLADSLSEARRLISQGAISVNGTKLTSDEPTTIAIGDTILKRGKNQCAFISK